MSGMSNYLEQKTLNDLLNGASAVYVALFTADPTDAGATTNEIATAGTAYARLKVNPNGGAAPAWNLAVDNGAGGFKVTNAADLNFAVATAAWGTITHIALFDAVTGGNMLYSGALNASKVIGNTDKFTIPAGALVVNLD